jgi:hypothetical protein
MNEQLTSDELSLDDMRSALAKWLAGLDGRQQNKRNIAGLLEAAFQRIDALKTRVDVLDVAFANSHQLNESLGDENRALRARVEAAEAERNTAARVAELEAQLVAQGWQPVTERPPADDEYLVWCSSYEGCEIQSYSSRLNRWYSNAGNDADYWRPLPPAPQETE